MGFGDLIRRVGLPLATLTRNKVSEDGMPVSFTSFASAKIMCHSPPSVIQYLDFVNFNRMDI